MWFLEFGTLANEERSTVGARSRNGGVAAYVTCVDVEIVCVLRCGCGGKPCRFRYRVGLAYSNAIRTSYVSSQPSPLSPPKLELSALCLLLLLFCLRGEAPGRERWRPPLSRGQRFVGWKLTCAYVHVRCFVIAFLSRCIRAGVIHTSR